MFTPTLPSEEKIFKSDRIHDKKHTGIWSSNFFRFACMFFPRLYQYWLLYFVNIFTFTSQKDVNSAKITGFKLVV